MDDLEFTPRPRPSISGIKFLSIERLNMNDEAIEIKRFCLYSGVTHIWQTEFMVLTKFVTGCDHLYC